MVVGNYKPTNYLFLTIRVGIMKDHSLKISLLLVIVLALFTNFNNINAQNRSGHQKPKSTHTGYNNHYGNSSSSTLSNASNQKYNEDRYSSNDDFLEQYKRNRYSRNDEHHDNRYNKRKNEHRNNKRKDNYSKRHKKYYSYNKTNTENYFHIDRSGRSLWDGKHWVMDDFPLKIYVKESSSRYYKPVYKDYVQYALNVWRKADDRISFVFVNSRRGADISIIFIENLGDKYEDDYLGLTEYEMGRNKTIDNSKIQISLIKFGDEIVSDGEIKATIIHEFGHALGLGHSNNEFDIMYPYISDKHTSEMNYDELSRGDKEAIQDVISLGDVEVYAWN